MQENQLYLSPLETQLNCTAGDVFRNSFTKKEDQTEDEEQSYYDHGHRRMGQHPFGGADRVLPEWIQWGGGGVVAEIFRVPYYVGGGGSSRNFPGSIFCGVAEFFPLTAVTDPKFVFFPVNCSNRP